MGWTQHVGMIIETLRAAQPETSLVQHFNHLKQKIFDIQNDLAF